MFLGLPSPTFSSSDAIKVFNWYTIPGMGRDQRRSPFLG